MTFHNMTLHQTLNPKTLGHGGCGTWLPSVTVRGMGGLMREAVPSDGKAGRSSRAVGESCRLGEAASTPQPLQIPAQHPGSARRTGEASHGCAGVLEWISEPFWQRTHRRQSPTWLWNSCAVYRLVRPTSFAISVNVLPEASLAASRPLTSSGLAAEGSRTWKSRT